MEIRKTERGIGGGWLSADVRCFFGQIKEVGGGHEEGWRRQRQTSSCKNLK